MGFRSFDEAFAWLAARTNYETMATQRYDERVYGLARARRLLRDVGRPDRAFDVAQIVGSKGKGSTAAALAAVLRATGRRTGLFTSPHLVDPRERAQVDGAPVADELMVDALGTLLPHVERAARDGAPATFFEIHTAASLLAFRAAGCDAVVLEAGMGGRLDATSAAPAKVRVLTSVSLDHVRQLGRTRAAIAREKAAQVRRGEPFVCGERADDGAGRVAAAACRAAGAHLLAIGREFRVDRTTTQLDPATGLARTSFRLRFPPHAPLDLEVPLAGRHQARNAALAAVAALTARWNGGRVRTDAVRAGLAATSLRARLEAISLAPLVLVDGAHTPASFGALADTLRRTLPGRRCVCVVGMSADKDVRGALRRLRGTAAHVVATSSGQPRAAHPDEVAAAARAAGIAVATAPDPSGALRTARRLAGRAGVVVVTGSLYLCGAVLASVPTSGPGHRTRA